MIAKILITKEMIEAPPRPFIEFWRTCVDQLLLDFQQRENAHMCLSRKDLDR